ncbi:MAG: CRISPR-associated protein Csy1 [Thiomicrorhabdus sp.]|nr:MAG: CRISPR-associated protein Csy1 [Thiomicrorhabdus sp.]
MMGMKMINEEVAKALAHEIKAYIRDRRDKKQESLFKDKPKKNKQGVVSNGAINARLAVIVENHLDDKEAYAAVIKSKKNKDQTSLEFQKVKYKKLLSLIPENIVDTDLLDLKSELHSLIQSSEDEYDTVTWLTEYSPKAKDISFATHVGKLTHSSSKSSSILDITTEKSDRYLTTNRLDNIVIDTASSNAASLPIAAVLQLSVDGISVLNCLKNGDVSFFKHITNNDTLINTWCNQLKQAYDSSQKKSYFLSKQTYFPIDDGHYHLLLPLKSSSLIHALHLEHKKYWDDEEREFARKQKSAKKYSSVETISYPNKAYLHVTGSNHSNASSLNGQRGGRVSLLPTTPPQWRSKGGSYLKKTSFFGKTLSYVLTDDINDLKKYLLLLKSKKLSISEPARHAVIMRKLEIISEHFFDYIQTINVRKAEEGWTCNSQLPIEQQLLLEPCRDDEIAKNVKINKEWQEKLSKSYGKWLNDQLKKKSTLALKPIHTELWGRYFLNELREFIATQEVML